LQCVAAGQSPQGSYLIAGDTRCSRLPHRSRHHALVIRHCRLRDPPPL